MAHGSDPDSAATRRVLVVDDDPIIRKKVLGYFESSDIECSTCRTTAEAYDLCAASPGSYGLVLTDICFADGGSGFRLAARLAPLRAGGGPSVIGMTSDPGRHSPIAAREHGMQDMIMKPLFKWLIVNLARDYCAPSTGSGGFAGLP